MLDGDCRDRPMLLTENSIPPNNGWFDTFTENRRYQIDELHSGRNTYLGHSDKSIELYH